ncbi:hypothetical protein [Jeotgalibacillus soli]|uniref:hypothetical protein n=1 Tax=Jeotgalibacillus soli TaxID=889306 RepID=UPI001F39A3C8|nr:hypothetical protein [Jeotgalibacillus soli]
MTTKGDVIRAYKTPDFDQQSEQTLILGTHDLGSTSNQKESLFKTISNSILIM